MKITHIKKIVYTLLIILTLSLFIGGCTYLSEDITKIDTTSNTEDTETASKDTSTDDSTSASATSTLSSTTDSATVMSLNVDYATEDIDSTYNESNATHIFLGGDTYEIEGSGITVDQQDIIISDAGTYIFSGTLTDGQIRIEATSNDNVNIVLNGVNLSSSDRSPLYSKQANKTTLTLADNTINRIFDSSDYIQDDTGSDIPNATIYVKDDLTINGSGTLYVNATSHNGITSKDHLVITNGTFYVTAANNGIVGKDSLSILDGTFNINAGGDGLKSTNDEDSKKGWLSIDGGTYNIVSKDNGLQAETLLQITAGTLRIDSEEDTLHSNAHINIFGSSMNLSAEDDGIHANGIFTINQGTIDITSSYEGIEGAAVNINGGTINIVASDDGINSAGGSDSNTNQDLDSPEQTNTESTENEAPLSMNHGDKNDTFMMESESANHITITDGKIYVKSGGDGLDANGDLMISGGEVTVIGPFASDNSALDFDGDFTNNGGVLLATGSSGMLRNASDNSTQKIVTIIYSELQDANKSFQVSTDRAADIIDFTLPKQFNSLIISSPTLQSSDTLTFQLDDESPITITLDSTITTVSEDGSDATATMGKFGGGQNGGGKGNKPPR